MQRLFWRYPLWKGIAFVQAHGWRTYWYGITLGQIGIGVMVRRRSEESPPAPSDRETTE